MIKNKPVISNQYGALVMAFIPLLYGISLTHFHFIYIFFTLSWLFLYLFSYPFLALFNRKPTTRNKKWVIIYAIISVIFALPVIFYQPKILQFFIPMIPLVLVQIYYTKQKDERNLINDIAGYLIFGIVGMAGYYLTTQQYNIDILIHPTLFFTVTTFYVKSVARERKNPLYRKLSINSHILLMISYALFSYYFIAFAYLCGLIRAIILPRKNLNIKQIGMWEFLIITIFTLCLIAS
ncbi:YwiC-like family protein [Pasteurella atlantica]|uniref:YwiC-like family protein n=2 Tax=Pasteurellaceae TaxID=712 RepID=A0ACC6HNR0_9PAST|nr:YwiC-like family protein [Pasteurella atlantica]MDP8052458.1 YwiC-like family protein [Pasteurella atlantica]MDP8100579.1 YwiC-like family protein [Pasteurella atlantica]MDP8105737.1 YwiC-like family protein [Pasteurella atlantica]MDP8149169.1 YwiC-like family protein [Pasteurella atlantica]